MNIFHNLGLIGNGKAGGCYYDLQRMLYDRF